MGRKPIDSDALVLGLDLKRQNLRGLQRIYLQHTGAYYNGFEQIPGTIIDEFNLRPGPQCAQQAATCNDLQSKWPRPAI
ncbi:hypothetical protein, partial [Pseudomonas avellanae]